MVIRPMELLFELVNHSAPSGPVVRPLGKLTPSPLKVEAAPAVVIRPIESFPAFVNHSAPSGPTVMPPGPLMPVPV